MGIFSDFLRPHRSLLTAAAVAVQAAAPVVPSKAPTQAKGISGGGNMNGRLMAEPNQELRDQAGYGQAGTYDVGQYALMAMTNPFVSMGMDHLLRPVAAARVDVEPAKFGVDEVTAQTHADFVSWALTEHFQLSRLSKTAASAFLLSGFALFEPLAELVPYGPATTQAQREDKATKEGIKAPSPQEVWALADCPQRLPNSLDPSNPWPVDDKGHLIGIGQVGPVGMNGKWVRTVLPAERALLLSWKREAGNFAGVSQLRSCWYLAGKVMPQLIKMIGVTLQREGPGIPQAISTDKDAKLTSEQREELVELYADISAHEAAGFVMPTGWKTEWTFSPVSNKGHILQVVERMGLWILQQFGAQQLVVGTGETGSYSAGQTHSAQSMAMVEEVLQFLADGYNGARREADGLVKKLIDWNFGPQVAYPKLKLTARRSELGPKEIAEAAKIAVDAKLLTPTFADENVIRAKLSLPPITEEERDAAKEAAAALAPQIPGQTKPEAEGHEEGSQPGPKQPKGKQPPGLSASAQRGAWKPWRALRASEEKVKFAAIDAYFAERKDDFELSAGALATGMIAVAGPAIARAMADGKVLPAEIAAVPLGDLRLLAFIRKFLKETANAGGEFVRGELPQRALTAAAGDPTDDADEVLEALAQAIKTRMLARARAEIEREAIDALRTGGGSAEVIERVVAAQVRSGAFRSDAGSITTKAFNVGRDEAARLMGGVESVEVSALLDNNTCEVCEKLDGDTAAFDSPEHDRLLPPMRDCEGRDNCRCLLLFRRGES